MDEWIVKDRERGSVEYPPVDSREFALGFATALNLDYQTTRYYVEKWVDPDD